MARSEKTAGDLREFASRISQIGQTLEDGADAMDENAIETIGLHTDDIVKRILPALLDWSIGIDGDIRRAIGRKSIETLKTESEDPPEKPRVGRPRKKR